MRLPLALRFLRRGKARFACAVLGVAAAVGAVVFSVSLKTSNDAQAPALARRAIAPWQSWISNSESRISNSKSQISNSKSQIPTPDRTLPVIPLTLDLRPGGHVLQGPPMRAALSAAPDGCPYANATLEGRWPDESAVEPEVAAFRSTLVRFGRGEPPALGSKVTFVGRRGTMTATLVGLLDGARVPRGWPDAFGNAAALAALPGEPRVTLSLWRDPLDAEGVQTIDDIADSFVSDAGRNFGRGQSLLLWAAALTALCLLFNSLFLSLEANRRTVALLRMVGLTRGGVARLALVESLLATAVGALVGSAAALAALVAFVRADPEMFPVGPAVSTRALAGTAIAALGVAVAAVLLLLRPALSVRPLEAASDVPSDARKRRFGMAVSFAFGFGAFVAVEVWGASLMKPFVPSPEWPDAIVSLLPAGVPRADLAKLRSIPGVARLSELRPLQLPFFPEEPMKGPGGGPGGRPQRKNALLLGSDHLPRFVFTEGSYDEAVEALSRTNACVLASMVAAGRGLHRGDTLRLSRRGEVVELPIAAIADVHWHMVTSRGLVRGLDGAPVMTEGPAFVSAATLESLRPAAVAGAGAARRAPAVASATHLWLDYEPAFLAEHGVFPGGRLVEEEIRGRLGDPTSATVRLHARDEIADGTLSHGSDIIGSMARIPFLFIAVLSIGFVAMLVASADASKHEFVVLRAVGATRGQLAGRLFREALFTASTGLALGLSGGMAVGACAAAATRASMSQWTIPACFVVPWRPVLLGAAVSFAFVVAVAIPASLLLVRREARAD